LGGLAGYEKFVANQPQTPVQNNTPVPTTSTAPAIVSFKNGTYRGGVTSSIYGQAQVELVISSGKITDVIFLKFPNDRQTTVAKSNMAMPIIKQEVIQSQSANVNTVSGATETSVSFIQSIADALSQAS